MMDNIDIENRVLCEVHNNCVYNGKTAEGINEEAYTFFVTMTRGIIHKLASRGGKIVSESDMNMCISEAGLMWIKYIQMGKLVKTSFVSMLYGICLSVYYRILKRKHRADGWSLEEWGDVGGDEIVLEEEGNKFKEIEDVGGYIQLQKLLSIVTPKNIHERFIKKVELYEYTG